MGIREVIEKHRRIMFDTAPIVYFIEEHEDYGEVTDEIFKLMRSDFDYHAFSSVITLTEVLTQPLRNSKGIRIPKAILEQCNIKESVILEIEKDEIVIMPENKKPRSNWAEAFKSMRDNKDDTLLISDKLDLDMEEWEW